MSTYKFLDTHVSFDPEKLSDGIHPYHEVSPGALISAEVKNGKIVAWVGTDANKKKLDTTVVKQSETKADEHSIHLLADTVTCWCCVEHSDGGKTCIKITCPQ